MGKWMCQKKPEIDRESLHLIKHIFSILNLCIWHRVNKTRTLTKQILLQYWAPEQEEMYQPARHLNKCQYVIFLQEDNSLFVLLPVIKQPWLILDILSHLLDTWWNIETDKEFSWDKQNIKKVVNVSKESRETVALRHQWPLKPQAPPASIGRRGEPLSSQLDSPAF